MDGYDFLDLAVRLSACRKEADLRSAVSRAYYGAYHLAMSLVEEAGIIMPVSAEAHDKLVWLLDAGQTPESCLASRMLGSLRKERNRSDYNLKDPKPSHSGNVRTQLIAAQDIAAALAICGVEPNRSSVISNMRMVAKNTLRLSVCDV